MLLADRAIWVVGAGSGDEWERGGLQTSFSLLASRMSWQISTASFALWRASSDLEDDEMGER
jgi:hypothetical protein